MSPQQHDSAVRILLKHRDFLTRIRAAREKHPGNKKRTSYAIAFQIEDILRSHDRTLLMPSSEYLKVLDSALACLSE